VLAALAETRLLLGEALDLEETFDLARPAPNQAEAFDVAPERPVEPSARGITDAFELDLALIDAERPAVAHTPASAISTVDDGLDDTSDLAALLALAAGPPEPEIEPVELDDDDSLSEALDAAVLSMPEEARAAGARGAQPAAVAGLELLPMDEDEAPFPASVPAARSERAAPAMVSQIVFDELDADPSDTEPVVLTPGVDLGEPRGSRPAAHGGARGARLAAVDAVVQLSEAAGPPARPADCAGCCDDCWDAERPSRPAHSSRLCTCAGGEVASTAVNVSRILYVWLAPSGTTHESPCSSSTICPSMCSSAGRRSRSRPSRTRAWWAPRPHRAPRSPTGACPCACRRRGTSAPSRRAASAANRPS
jgi:hypothetical protein